MFKKNIPVAIAFLLVISITIVSVLYIYQPTTVQLETPYGKVTMNK